MKAAALTLIHVLEAPLILLVVVVFLLWTAIHWIEDEWLGE